MAITDGLGAILLPKGKGVKGGRGYSTTFNPRTDTISAPLYRDHLDDIYTSRVSNDARTLLATLVNTDPDISAAVSSFLTMAESVDPVIFAYDVKDNIDTKGIALGQQIFAQLTTTNDYTIGYSAKDTVDAMCNNHRYMVMLRGMTAGELVLDKAYVPSELRIIDPGTIEWHEKQNGVYAPLQKPAGSNDQIDLNIPTFFTSYFHQSPLSVYSYSPFVSAINTIATRTQVINDLYRIMKITGYPRMDISVVQEVLNANAPPQFRNDPKKVREFVEDEMGRIRQQFAAMQASGVFVHSDAVQAKIINDKNPGVSLPIENVIQVLDAQNQAALKVMPAVVGKGSNGQVASTEARLFALSADALNRTVAGILTKALTLAARLSGYDGRIEVVFPPVELRPRMELEPQLTMKSSRLKQDLSLGLITDIEYSMEMYGRPPLPGQPELSGTGFLDQQTVSVNSDGVTPNSDPLGRSQSGDGGNGVATDNKAKSGNTNKKPAGKLTFEIPL
ncbi:MAG: hypothetical protein ACTHJR_16465 [Sphingomonas sp.]|uniref:hypothetical protein n=1 Tax=Sphingomonas sp. TaxID=28214 RepID=UPI003F81A86B